MKLTVETKWNTWEKNLCNLFAIKGWSPFRHALAFKYQAVSLLDYALKKEKLLLEENQLVLGHL